MKTAVQWKEKMVFVGMPDSGFPVQLDSDSYFGGTNSGVRPMELVALGLAGCTAMDVLSILQKKRQKVTGFEVKVDAPRSAEHPQVFTGAVILYMVTGNNLDETALLRSIELSFTKYCPVQKMLEGAVPMELHYEIYEDEGDGSRRLTFQGKWQELSVE
ncbi:MAG TPA: OsmC family protein [Anaerolineales bacterium]|nr:OsmC family protein [Anaerolineales bacterium]